MNYTYVVTLNINQMGGKRGSFPTKSFFFLFFNSKWTFEKVTPLQSALKIEKNPKEHTISKVQFLSKNS